MSELKQKFYSQYDGAYRLYLELIETNTNITENTSSVSYRLGMERTSNNRFNQYRIGYSVSLNNVSVAYCAKNNAPQNGFNSGVYDITIISGSTTVQHNNDGSLNMPFSASIDMAEDTYGPGPMSLSGSFTLTTIPRASSIALTASSVEVGKSITVNITRASSTFKHKVFFFMYDKDDSNNRTKYCSNPNSSLTDSTSVTYTIPNDWCNNMPSSTSHIAYCEVQTWSGSTQIGKTTKKFTVAIPNGVKPTINEEDIGFTIKDILVGDNQISNILVKDKNGLTINVSNCTAGAGSSISSYTFSGPSFSETLLSSNSYASIDIPPVSNAGELTYSVTVTDARGRSNSASVVIMCHDYYTPFFKTFNAYRADENGDADINGPFLMYDYSIDYASVNNSNNTSVMLTYVTGNNINTIKPDGNPINLGNTTLSYRVYATIEDVYGGYDTSHVINIFGESRIMNITSDGTGFAIGKVAEKNELFECRWPAKFNDSIDCSGVTINNKSIFDLIYPVGSIYMSMNDINPGLLFGGEWEQLKNMFLLGAGDSYNVGDTGGEATHTLTINELPTHRHIERVGWGDGSTDKNTLGIDGKAVNLVSGVTGPLGVDRDYSSNDNTVSGNQPHNNMPPYLAVYMWKRKS